MTKVEHRRTLRFLIGFFGGQMMVSKVTSLDARRFLAWYRERDYRGRTPAPATVNKVLREYKRIFREAVACSLIRENPFHEMRQEKVGQRPWQFISPTEFRKLIESSPSLRWQGLITLGYCCGLRLGEVLNLTWSDINFERMKHVLVEKPLTDSVETAEALVDLAERCGRILQVDHTFVYNSAVQKIRSIIDSGEIGDLLYVDCVRVNLGLFQNDVNVLWDLAAHDVSIISYLIDRPPLWVSAIGSAHYGKLESQAYVTIKFDASLIAHLHVNWLAPVKLRSTLIGGSKRMIVYDDLDPSEKIRVYEKGVTLNSDAGARERALVDYRIGDMFAPHLEKSEPLGRACSAFLEAIRTGAPSLSDGRAGLGVVRILEAAQRSLRVEGERVSLELAG